MRLYPISKKVGVINNNTKENLQVLIQKMKSKTKNVISSNGCGFTAYTTGGILKESNNAVYGAGPLPNNKSIVCLNNKRYIVNNATGEIIPEKTTLKNLVMFSSKKLISGISDVINTVKEHFDNSEIVEQYSWLMCRLTGKGAKRFKETQRKITEEMKKDS